MRELATMALAVDGAVADGDGGQPRASLPPVTTFELVVEPSTYAVTSARRSMQRWLVAWECPPDFVADIALVVAELMTNAVAHVPAPALLSAELRDGLLRVVVADASTVPPDPPDPGHDAGTFRLGSGGWGLRIVASIADAWGWSSTATGKQVWSEHRFPPAPPDR
jgi:anti-sigma regulatory factor (Ser/Thr protein kinase)